MAKKTHWQKKQDEKDWFEAEQAIEDYIAEEQRKADEQRELEAQQRADEEHLTKTEKARKNWAAYKSIEEDLIRVLEFIPLETRQYGVFSFKLADIIIRCSTQVESILKELIRERALIEEMEEEKYKLILKKVKRGKATFLTLIEPYQKILDLEGREVIIRQNGDIISPYSTFYESQEEKIPFWWTAYNKLKHDFSKNLEYATIQASLNAMGALLVLICSTPRNQEHLILNGVITSPNFVHISDLLKYTLYGEGAETYNILVQTPIFQFWLEYNPTTIGMTVTGQLKVGG